MSQLKVKYLPLQPHCFAFGGFEVQMLAAFDAVKNAGYDVEKLDVWDRSEAFDALHCWGLSVANYENYYWAKKSGKLLVATVLLYYYETFFSRLKFHISAQIDAQKFHRKMLAYPDAVVVINEKQADVCNLLYKVPAAKISIIPNIVNSNFFEYGHSGKKGNFLLTVGNVCQRKNQLILAEVCAENGVELVIIGKPLDGESAYSEKLEAITKATPVIKWIKGLGENSNELISYYQNCLAYVLPSLVEQQPISALEAAVMKKPILLADADYSRQKYFANARLVNPLSKQSILKGINEILSGNESYVPVYENLLECRQENVAKAYINVYNAL